MNYITLELSDAKLPYTLKVVYHPLYKNDKCICDICKEIKGKINKLLTFSIMDTVKDLNDVFSKILSEISEDITEIVCARLTLKKDTESQTITYLKNNHYLNYLN